MALTNESHRALLSGWTLAEVPTDATLATIRSLPDAQWLPASVPGSAHGALRAAGRIPDPNYGLQETEVQWVGERSWAWRLQFDEADAASSHEELVFEGLDTWCTAWLNGTRLFSSDNMFVPQRADVRDLLKTGLNELVLRFDPPLAQARQQEALLGKRHLWNGDSARLYARKAQYHFGWDWGPVLLTSGPWKPVHRASWDARIDTVACSQQLDLAAGRATLKLNTRVLGAIDGCQIEHELFDPDGHCVAGASSAAELGEALLNVEAARWWWPRDLGEPALYTLRTRITDDGKVLASDSRRIGLRTVRLVQAPVRGEPGLSFCFEVNGQEIFAGGANWIPDDNQLERISPERYRERVAQAAGAHMNMLRVWGGGIYEDDAFYDACDELGILVWQDFMFACGMYPAHPSFQRSVREEARAAVTRLRHHASLAIWCGNNEDYAIAESIGAHGPNAPAGRFDARAIYEQLLPEVCAELDPGRPYWPGSPYTPNATGVSFSSDATVGDRHSWEVWHQQMLPYQRYTEVQARFVSEFGMQSHPSLPLLEAHLPPDERYPQSRSLAWHNKAGAGAPDGHRRLAVYQADNLRVGNTLAEHVYATQFVQAEAMRYAYQDFRRRWQTPGARAVGGALVWQLNDCWPVTSWALIDSAGVVKPAWHAIRRALAPLAVALRLEPGLARIAVLNGGSTQTLKLHLRVLALDGRELHSLTLDWTATAHSSTERKLPLPTWAEPAIGELLAQDAETGAEQASDCAWPEPFRFHTFASVQPRFALAGHILHIEADAPLKGLWLEAAGTLFDNNFIDLMPGKPQRVTLSGAALGALRWTALDHPATALPQVAVRSVNAA
ncbi:glycoside hydrolase family 2 protein [Ideonella sp.]|uniref:glycoside hydrolase family 2 protein n=1 Tax=Ideonella sp. TaxID=1929293 RepID=UPI003BB755E5